MMAHAFSPMLPSHFLAIRLKSWAWTSTQNNWYYTKMMWIAVMVCEKPTISDGTVEVQNMTSYGFLADRGVTAFYSCDDRYQLPEGISSMRTCHAVNDRGAVWSGDDDDYKECVPGMHNPGELGLLLWEFYLKSRSLRTVVAIMSPHLDPIVPNNMRETLILISSRSALFTDLRKSLWSVGCSWFTLKLFRFSCFAVPCHYPSNEEIRRLIRSNATFSGDNAASARYQRISVTCPDTWMAVEGPKEFTCGPHATWRACNCHFTQNFSNCPVPPICRESKS